MKGIDERMKKGYIVLENGQVFEGKRFGYEGDAVGELVFSTSAVGYIETLTDECYRGQILMQTFPLIGNYGWISSDANGKKIQVSAYIGREWCEAPSNFRCEETIDAALKADKIPGLCGVDTRALTRLIRDNGVMNAAICDDPSKVDLEALKSYKITGALKSSDTDVSCKAYSSSGARYNVTVINYGSLGNTVESLTARGCNVNVYPYTAKAEEILSGNPDGIVLSNGAGDPAENTECIAEIAKLVGKKPIFAISLGHQMLALAKGAKTYKLKYGHRGGNQPVKYTETGKTYITNQNHGYAVDNDSVSATDGKLMFINGNDGSCEGIEYVSDKAFSVQFVPEKGCSTMDTEELLFDKFIKML